MESKIENVFVAGAISPDFIAKSISTLQSNSSIGAHDIFLGQVRADTIDQKIVSAIDYSAYETMANQKFLEIKSTAFDRYNLSEVQIYHSLGRVNVGEICLFVLVASPHRKEAFEGLRHVVEAIKKEVPVFGKEVFGDDSYQWKVNT